MDNQHRKIAGYRELEQTEIDLMNAIKEKSNEMGELVRTLPGDQRWAAIGRTQIQQGVMACIRAITQPEGF